MADGFTRETRFEDQPRGPSEAWVWIDISDEVAESHAQGEEDGHRCFLVPAALANSCPRGFNREP
jgi:hypothetical protein